MKGSGRHWFSVTFVVALASVAVVGFAALSVRPILGLDLVGGVSLVLTAPEGTETDVVDLTLENIRSRVDAFGVSEPDITRQGDLNIVVQIPEVEAEGGGDRQERLLELIGKTAQLEFRIVEESTPQGAEQYEATEVTEDPAKDQEVVLLGDPNRTKYRLGEVLMTGDVITRAAARIDDQTAAVGGTSGPWLVSFELSDEGDRLFTTITQQNVGRQLAIVLDDVVESAPTIQDAITGGSGVITGSFTEQEAKDLATVLKVGSLPVELTPSQVQTVSATLGKESLDQGLLAGVAGLTALALYLFFYYRLLGIVTWLGMTIWTILALALISLAGEAFGYSLTLAGIAGVVVSLGITADSYIVFYERLKDEVRQGKTVRAAVVPAFQRAWHTIVAADIVTIMAAVILYLIAIGSVRGFALTLGLATGLDMFVVYFFKRPAVYLIARSTRLSEMRGMGLRSGVAADPLPVRGGSR